ncbi:MAG: TIGR00341 family protein [Syntrophomonadaceae bacterium]|nr:TIGR00341 family protein [Syntrophomonadaceae bacterium]
MPFSSDYARKMSPAQKISARQRIIEPSRPSGSFYLLVCLSAIIATLGLLANSTAVVIGAMLVAPLMSPIFGIALGLASGDRQLLKTALLADIAGIILAVALSALIGMIPLRPDFGSEILARTQPNIYDVLIALASGLAGAYALVHEKISPVLPGVAIATALVPPLAACGLNVAAGNWPLAWGAFLLFLVNFIAIEFAAASVFMLAGLVELAHTGHNSKFKAIFSSMGVSLLILVLATGFMTQTLIKIVSERQLEKQIRTVLTGQLDKYAGARLSELNYAQEGSELEVIATVITPQGFAPKQVADLEGSLKAIVNPQAGLIVRSVITEDADRNGPVFVSVQELRQRSQAVEEARYMNDISLIISEEMRKLGGAQVSNVSKEVSDDNNIITAVVRSYQAITPAQVQKVEQRLNAEVDSQIRLIVRTAITKDADSQEFLHQAVPFEDALQEQELDLYKRMLNEINWYLQRQVSGIMVADLWFKEGDDHALQVYVTVKTPVILAPMLVAELQEHLVRYIDPRIVLIVESKVGGVATASELYQTDE